MSFGIGNESQLNDFVTLSIAIGQEAIRRGVGLSVALPSHPSNPEGVPSFGLGMNFQPALYNRYVSALNQLNTRNTFTPLAPKSAGISTLYWDEFELLVNRIAALAAEVLFVTLPNPLDITIGSISVKGSFQGAAPNRVFTVTQICGATNYCGAGWQCIPGSEGGISHVTVDSTVNDEGYQAERLSIGFNYRRGCGCGNDQRFHWGLTVIARSGNAYYGYNSLYVDQWGC